MKPIVRAGRMKPVHSDIRGPLFVEAMNRQKQGILQPLALVCLTASKTL